MVEDRRRFIRKVGICGNGRIGCTEESERIAAYSLGADVERLKHAVNQISVIEESQ